MHRNGEIPDRATDIELAQAHSLLAAGEVRQSAAIAERLARREPVNPHVWHLLSGIYARVGQLPSALKCAERAAALAPTDPTFLVQHGQCLVTTGHRREAVEIANRIAGMDLHRADWNDALGTLLTFCEEPTRALPFFMRAVELSPANSHFLYNLATAQRMTGDFASAEVSLNRVIAIRPDDIDAYVTRASLGTQTIEANHIDELIRVLQREGRTPQEEVALGFAIAKELEDIGRYPQSFAYLKRANDLQQKQIQYSVAEDIALIDRVIQLHDRATVDVDGGFETDECIFVIGLPRSGTTLVERILSSHSSVTAAGELQAFPHELSKAVRMLSKGSIHPLEFMQLALHVNAAALGRAYIDATRPQTGKTPHFVDKLPMNYLNAGLIRRALPRARIVALARDPMDSCYAMYKTLFVGAYHFSYDLADLAQYYAAWHRLMRHWDETLGDNLLIVQYEDLVTHQEEVSRRILAHCRLEWQDACLEFHRQKSAVTSASAAQVRHAMYSSSVGKWRHLELELRSLGSTLAQLEPASGWRFDTRSSR